MCGFVDAFDLSSGGIPLAAGLKEALRAQVLGMSKKIRHRCPDWSGVYTGDNAILSHERLSIVDPLSGKQPLASADGSQDISRTKRGLNSKLYLAVDEYGIPASGTIADCNQAPLLMEDLEAEAFFADRAYDTNELLDMLKEADITTVIPPVKNRKEQRVTSWS